MYWCYWPVLRKPLVRISTETVINRTDSCLYSFLILTVKRKNMTSNQTTAASFHILPPLYWPIVQLMDWGTRWRSWLSHCATSRKVSGSIPDGVIGIFHWHNPSGRTMALGSNQPLTEMSIRDISWWWVRRVDNLTTFMCRLSWNLGASASWNPSGPIQACNGIALPLPLPINVLDITVFSNQNFERNQDSAENT